MMWRYPDAWSGNFNGLGGIGMGIGMIVNTLVIVGVIYLVVRLFRGGFGCHGQYHGHVGHHAIGGLDPRGNSQEAVNIINRRYASGEITREEYHQMMDINKTIKRSRQLNF